MEVTSRSVNDESALFDDDGDDEQIVVHRTGGAQSEKESSRQRLMSLAKVKPQFEGLRVTAAGHRIQEIKELMSVPVSGLVAEPACFLICLNSQVIVTADLTKSPPVIKVYASNPFAKEK